MSIRIDQNKCIGCSKCCQVCPGSLIIKNEDKKSDIKYPRDCWGCTSCLKECPVGAISYYLGADMGGNGTYLYTKKDRHFLHWHIVKANEEEVITINQHESNNY